MYIPLLSANVFPYLKNKKRVSPKRTIKGKKETKIKKGILNMNPTKMDHESVACSNATTISLLLKIRLCAACPKCHNPWGSNRSILTFHALNFMLIDRE